MKKITIIGGGTGSYTLLKGLRDYHVDLSAIITTADSGGSSGQLRDEFGVLPPSDLRRCLIALSEKRNDIWRKIFEYRFNGVRENNNLGNLIITALTKIVGSLPVAIDAVSELLEVKGKIIPITLDDVNLCAMLEDGQVISGETNIDIPKHDPNLKIKEVFLQPKAFAYKEAIQTIFESQLIIIGPGDLYTSIIPNLLVEGIASALKETSARIFYVTNVMTKQGETNNFSAQDFVKEIQKYSNNSLDGVICNNKKPDIELAEVYAQENSFFVEPDIIGQSNQVIKADLIEENPEVQEAGKRRPLIRHSAHKLAKIVMEL